MRHNMRSFAVNLFRAFVAQTYAWRLASTQMHYARDPPQDLPDIWGENVMSPADEHSKLSIQLLARAWKVLSSAAVFEGTTLKKPTHLDIHRNTNPKSVFPIQ